MRALKEPEALLGWKNGFLLFYGPFSEQPIPAPDAPHFILPRFFEAGKRYFLRPSRWQFLEAAELRQLPQLSLNPTWEPECSELFFKQFADIQSKFAQHNLDKIVPAHVWKASVPEAPSSLLSFLERFLSLKSPGKKTFEGFYAWKNGEKLCVGQTPELLCSVEKKENNKGELQTEALAGTAPRGQESSLLQSSKDLIEHDWVVRSLVNSLSPLVTQLQVDKLTTKQSSSLCHLRTRLHAELSRFCVEDCLEILRALHPTPALGVYPKNSESLAYLKQLRDEAGVDNSFGAPMGVLWRDTFKAWVCIRNLLFEGNQLRLHTGCGIVKESRVHDEWQELRYKREAVCRSFRIKI